MERLSKILGAQNKFEDAFAMLEQAQQLSYQEEDGKYEARVHSTLSYLHAQQDSLELAFIAIDSAHWYASRTSAKIVQGNVDRKSMMQERGGTVGVIRGDDRS